MPSSDASGVKVAARASPLSRAQVEEVERELRTFHPYVNFSPEWVQTHGDQDRSTSLRALGKSDFFTREVDAKVLAGACRVSVHSAKDLPESFPKGLKLLALTRGVDPRDALVFREEMSFKTLPRGARIGTSSGRRDEMLKAMRSDFICTDVRGTIEERLELIDQGVIDGLVVAEAALIRLGLTHLPRLILEGETAPLQGRLAILAREDDEEMHTLFACLDHGVS